MIKKLIALFFGIFSSQVAAATRDSILQSSDRIAGFVDVPEWGGRVHLATLTVTQRARFLECMSQLVPEADAVQRAQKYYEAQLALVADAVVGPDSAPLFSADDIDRLATKSPAIVGRIFDEVVRLNGFSATATEDVAKN